MAKITFTSNIYREAFSLIGRGLSMACKETGRVLNEAVHSQPYIFMAAEALLLIVLSFVYIGSARAERDHASKQYVRIQHKADSLAVASELWHNLYKKGGKLPPKEKKMMCPECGCVFMYERSDIHSDQREGCWVVCPTCKKFIDVDGRW